MRNGPVIKYMVGEPPPRDIPVQYLKGWVEFYKLKFKVTPEVLIPRPETELLVDSVLHSELCTLNSALTILDLGTGSGCIAISLAKNLPKAKVFAIDISEEALEVARENAKKNRVQNKIFFLKSDLLNVILGTTAGRTPESNQQKDPGQARMTIDIIVANLPYIPTSRIPYLDPSVKDFEPRIALDGGPDGFDLYRKLFQQVKEKFLPVVIPSVSEESQDLKPRDPSPRLRRDQDDKRLKLIVCEIDESQAKVAVKEAQKYFPKAKVEIKNDLAKKPRILIVNLQHPN